MRASLLIGLTTLMLAIDVHGASAQTNQWQDNARVSINFGEQVSSTTFGTTTTSIVYLETATINTTYTVPKGPLFDGGILFRLRGSFGVGVAVSSYSKQSDAPVTGSIPHPFFFNANRALSGTATGLQRNEIAAHIQAAYVVESRRVDLAVFGGPTIFRVSQDVVLDAVYAETFPYDTVTFTSATTARAEGTKIGFNVGVDVGYRLSRTVGVGGLVRYSRATLSFPVTGSASNLSVDAGGLQAGGGVRFYF
jgi:hypothetical protein